MNRRTLARLSRDGDLWKFLARTARRHFRCAQDQDDAVSEAWEKLAEQPICPKDVRRFMYQKIKNRYDRALYQRHKQACAPIDPNTIPNTAPDFSERIG